MSVLLVDGDNLLTIGFYGLKNHFYKGKHIGGIFHFIDTLRRNFETHHLDKIVVFWDGEDNSHFRKQIYQHYKDGRSSRFDEEGIKDSYDYQKQRIQQYLEELYVRQGCYQYCETDDCVSYYVKNSPKENKIIYSSDMDLVQLVGDSVQIYNPSHRKLYKKNDIVEYKKELFHIENIKIIKTLCGDPSDNIFGIYGLGLKKIKSLFPDIETTAITISEIKERGNVMYNENRSNKTLQNLLTGVTKFGVFGEEFFDINDKIVNLDNPFLTDDAKENILTLINEKLDPEGRSYKNTMKLMVEDGLFTILPKSDDAWIKFLNPFLRLTRKEKNKK